MLMLIRDSGSIFLLLSFSCLLLYGHKVVATVPGVNTTFRAGERRGGCTRGLSPFEPFIGKQKYFSQKLPNQQQACFCLSQN